MDYIEDYKARDLWYESRQKSREYKGEWLVRLISFILRLLFPKRYKSLTATYFGTDQSVLCVDLNKYRPDVNVEMLIDQGIRVFMLRVGGPTQWIYANWKYEVDATFVPYYNRIREYAKLKNIKVWIIGYGVHNPWSNEEGNYIGKDPQVTWLKEATRNQICDLYCWDDEVGECWKDSRNTTITGVNLVKSVSRCIQQTWDEFERHSNGLQKPVLHYSAAWFINKYAKADYTNWLDNSNKSVDTRILMTWRAWLPTVFTETFSLITLLFDKAISPTGIQENSYLKTGSGLSADFWQLSFTAKGPWCGPKSASGIDASISYGPSNTLTKFIYNANLPVTEPEPEEPDDPGTIEELTGKVTKLVAWAKTVSVSPFQE